MALSRRAHPLLPNQDEGIRTQMLSRIGAGSVDELFRDIPEGIRLRRRLRLPRGEPESSLRREVGAKLSSGKTPPNSLCFLGGGVWPHYVPAAVESIVSRQEFYTSYTPYQPEISQGMLQGLFEYQSLMCDLLSMEACNSSMYDWASAAGEAARMVAHVTGRKKLLVGGSVAPHRLEVIKTYAGPMGLELLRLPWDRRTGTLDVGAAAQMLGDDVAGVYLENPNYFGVIEDRLEEFIGQVHARGGLAIIGVDPVSLSLLRTPGELGADIAVGEGQPLGIAMNYGGPHLGIFAVKDLKLARSMPGRLIGITTMKDSDQKAFSMVLQTREQHIRREAATSNICTNQSLMAIAAASYLALLGKIGFRKLGEVVISNSHYAARRLAKVKGLTSPLFKGPYFKEFAVGYTTEGTSASSVFKGLSRRGVIGGYPLGRSFGMGEAGLYCVTEVHTPGDIEALAVAIEEVL
jgi:glycine dehydrogenase subunit 1